MVLKGVGDGDGRGIVDGGVSGVGGRFGSSGGIGVILGVGSGVCYG